MSEQDKDFQQGALDCIEGVKPTGGESQMYEFGYSMQYELEQKLTAKSEIIHG